MADNKSLYRQKLLENLHLRKASYQPNMLKATAVVTLLALLFGFWLSTLIAVNHSEHTGLPDNNFGKPISKIGGNDSSIGRQLESAGVAFLTLIREYTSGFAGFNGYRIVRDKAESISISKPQTLSAISGLSEQEMTIVSIDPEGMEEDYYGLGIGGLGDHGLPEGENLISSANTRYPFGKDLHTIITQERREPVILQLKESLRIPASLLNDTGEVAISFIITKNGAISDRVLELEYPEGIGLAQAVFKVLNEAVVFPAKVNNINIDCRILLVWTICRQCGREISASDNLIVSMD